MNDVYTTSPVKRRRATQAEMEDRARFIINYAEAHGPMTVRGLFYQAETFGVPGIDKSEQSYNRVQRQVLQLRRAGRLSYDTIADSTRWMRKPSSFDSVEDAIRSTARLYRRNLWNGLDDYVEVWIEKDALAGVILPVTAENDVPLMVARGYSSETFAYEAAAARRGDTRRYVVYYLGDFDRAGQDAGRTLKEKLVRFCDDLAVAVDFRWLGLTEDQIARYSLATRPPKRKTPADRKWPHRFACELDAVPPDELRSWVEEALSAHLPLAQLDVLKQAEASEREYLHLMAERHL